MKKLLFLSLLAFAGLSFAQEGTTFILVRHAEKSTDHPEDPSLTTQGQERARNLASLLAQADIVAIYSTGYKRTRQTVEPLATAKGLTVQNYQWQQPKYLVKEWLEKHSGGTVVVSGHSNTTPRLANALLGREAFTDFEDSDYGNILVIFVDSSGQGRLLHLRF